MAADSDGKLTKFESTVTVVTADFANSIFGGLYGSGEASSLDPEDPRIRGHVHDGENIDGHAPLVNLVEHVEDKLLHENLADHAVHRNNVRETVNIGEAIPESYETGGTTYYYLDLRGIRADLVFVEEENPSTAASTTITEHRLIKQRDQSWDGSAYVDIADVWDSTEGLDFVFGSSSLEDIDSGTDNGDNRFLFDKSKGAFRAGGATETQWDEDNRGQYSVAFGYNSEADSDHSVVSGGHTNKATGAFSAVGGGDRNEAQGTQSVVSGGVQNIASATLSTISGGQLNAASGQRSTISGGQSHQATAQYSTVSGGYSNLSSGTGSVVSGGNNNQVSFGSDYSAIGGGTTNTIDNGSTNSTISGGSTNTIDGTSTSAYVGGGDNNTIDSSGSATLSGGKYNKIDAASSFSTIAGGGGVAEADGNYISGASSSFIGGGTNNSVTQSGSVISGGSNNEASGDHSVVSGGGSNQASGDYSAVSGGGGPDPVDGNDANAPGSYVGGGRSNSSQADYSSIVGGDNNELKSNFSVIAGGQNNIIHELSANSVIGGGGGAAGEGNSINIAYNAIWNTASCPANPSPVSGIFGGKYNHIVGGNGSIGFNFIVGGEHNGIGAVEGTVSFSSIIGGTSNDITAISGGSHVKNSMIGVGDRNVIGTNTGNLVDYCAISSGKCNSIVATQNSGSQAILCTISGGFKNEIVYAGQTSAVISGCLNTITSDPGPFSSSTSVASAIVSGFKNNIIKARGSAIVSGGAVIDDTIAPNWDHLPAGIGYSTASGAGNSISGSDYSSILGGSSNEVVENSHFSSILSGLSNKITNGSKYSSIPYGSKNIINEYEGMETSCASAAGLESHSYTFGQASLSSGNFNVLAGILGGYTPNPGPSNPGITGGNSIPGETGGAQSFVLNAFGHWQYPESEINDPAASVSGGEYVAFFDGVGVKFLPRKSSVYSFNMQCVLSFSEVGSSSIHHFIAFDYKGGISVNYDGSGMLYGAQAIVPNYNSSGATISNTGAADFQVKFTHNLTTPVHEQTTAMAVLARSPMAIHVKNTSAPGTWTASSLSVKAEFVECRLYYRGWI